ncbi:MAG: DNA polymerase Y family protein [Myxococcota bacterium]
MRVGCLLVPDLPLQAALRAEPELRGRPRGITSGPGNRAEVVAVAESAAKQAVRQGQTLPQARAVCPEIEVRVASPVLERTAREALLDVALSLAPRAEAAPRGSGIFASEGVVFVDASGTTALHGDESSFASVFHARAERAGIPGFVAIASTRGVSRLAARHLSLAAMHRRLEATGPESPTTRILPREREVAFLEPLPIDLLDPDDRTAEALTRFGVRRVRELLRLPRRDLAARIGPQLLELVARARGEEEEPPIPEPKTTTLEEGQDLEAAIVSLEPLTFVLRGLVSRLTERLALRGLGCTELRLGLELENGARQSRRVGVATPSQDEQVLLRLLRLTVERAPPMAPIESVTLLCEALPLRREQLDLFLPRGPSPSDLDQTLAELASLCGEDRVGAPEIVDTHRPDAFGLKPFRKPKRPNAVQGSKRARPARQTRSEAAHPPRTAPPRRGPRLSMRALRPAVRAQVHLVNGRPAHLRCRLGQGEIVKAAGPWRTTGHWWSESAHFAVDHYDIELGDGTVLRLAFDWKTKRWQIDGLYD